MSKELPPEVAEFDKELYNLFDSRAVSASKIDKLTKLAFKAAKVRIYSLNHAWVVPLWGLLYELIILSCHRH